MSLPPIIGFMGAAGSGKDTAGIILREYFEYRVLRFAAPIKRAVEGILRLAPFELEQNSPMREEVIPEIGASPRQLLQTLGTEWGREMVHQDIWVQAVAREIDQIQECTFGAKLFCITDVRFNNEVEWIRSQGGIVVEIIRDVPAIASHKSESSITLTPDVQLTNDSTTTVFEEVVKFMMLQLEKR